MGLRGVKPPGKDLDMLLLGCRKLPIQEDFLSQILRLLLQGDMDLFSLDVVDSIKS
jgi:hypothetical protein